MTDPDPHRDSGTGDAKQSVDARRQPLDFNVEKMEDVRLDGPSEFMRRDWMSPYAWRDRDGRFGIMVRAVPRSGAPRRRLTGLPAFVSTRGGEYFFLPGIAALRSFADSPAETAA